MLAMSLMVEQACTHCASEMKIVDTSMVDVGCKLECSIQMTYV